ncbi:hypothetical protein D9M72_462810 [compost metagenome]
MVRDRIEPRRAGMMLDSVARVEGVHNDHVKTHHQFVLRRPQQVEVEVLVGRGEPFDVLPRPLELGERPAQRLKVSRRPILCSQLRRGWFNNVPQLGKFREETVIVPSRGAPPHDDVAVQ